MVCGRARQGSRADFAGNGDLVATHDAGVEVLTRELLGVDSFTVEEIYGASPIDVQTCDDRLYFVRRGDSDVAGVISDLLITTLTGETLLSTGPLVEPWNFAVGHGLVVIPATNGTLWMFDLDGQELRHIDTYDLATDTWTDWGRFAIAHRHVYRQVDGNLTIRPIEEFYVDPGGS